MDESMQRAIESGVPMVVVPLGDNADARETECYNLENIQLADWQIKKLYRMAKEFYADPENRAAYEKWKASHGENNTERE